MSFSRRGRPLAEEEKATDIKLTDLAINNVNKKAENKA